MLKASAWAQRLATEVEFLLKKTLKLVWSNVRKLAGASWHED